MLKSIAFIFLIGSIILPAAHAQGVKFFIRGQGSGKCVSVTHVSKDNGALIVIFDCIVGSLNQFWTIQDGGQSWNSGLTNGFVLVAEHSGKCISVVGQRTDNGAPLVQWDCLPRTNNQLWEIIPSNEVGYYQIRNPASNRCMSVLYQSTANEAQFVLWDCQSTSNQKFNQQPPCSPI